MTTLQPESIKPQASQAGDTILTINGRPFTGDVIPL